MWIELKKHFDCKSLVKHTSKPLSVVGCIMVRGSNRESRVSCIRRGCWQAHKQRKTAGPLCCEWTVYYLYKSTSHWWMSAPQRKRRETLISEQFCLHSLWADVRREERMWSQNSARRYGVLGVMQWLWEIDLKLWEQRLDHLWLHKVILTYGETGSFS